jgi:adenylate cyclase
MLNFSSDITALPARLQLAIREQQADAEILIAWIQLAIVLLFSVVYAAAPKAFPEMSRFEPVPLVLGAYVAITFHGARRASLEVALEGCGHPHRQISAVFARS